MKAIIFWPVAVLVMVLDVVSKTFAVSQLAPSGVPHPVIGNGLRFALVYNPGAAFGLYLGQHSRWIFMALTLGALFILWRLYRATEPGDIARTLAVTLVSAGAIGNLIDRIRGDLGVVDFIDIGMGDHRWPTFNIADMAVSGGAFLLAWVLWGEDKKNVAVTAANGAGAGGVAVAVHGTPGAATSPTHNDLGESS